MWYLLPALNTASFQAVLENFARDVLDGTGKRALVLDNAAWHKCVERAGWIGVCVSAVVLARAAQARKVLV